MTEQQPAVCDICGEDAVVTWMHGDQSLAVCADHLSHLEPGIADVGEAILNAKRRHGFAAGYPGAMDQTAKPH